MLYLEDPDHTALSRLLEMWHAASEENGCSDDDIARNCFGPSVDDSVYGEHVKASLQILFEEYFGSHWDRVKEVVDLNRQYAKWIVRVCARKFPDIGVHLLPKSAGNESPGNFVHANMTFSHSPMEEEPDLMRQPNSTMNELREAFDRGCQRVLLIFHAAFSPRSNKMVKIARALSIDGLSVVTVNVFSSVEVVRAFKIKTYPAAVLLCAPGPTSRLEMSTSLDNLEPHYFPARAAVEDLPKWVDSNGTFEAEEQSQELNSLDALPAAKRELFFRRRDAKSQRVIQQQMGCDDDSCIIPRQPTADDPPRFIFLGGGMAAGKTTSTAVITRTEWWKHNGAGVVVVCADEFKFEDQEHIKDPNSHEYSTRKAEELLVNAVNTRRDIVFDSTMMWKPFVEQVIQMVRKSNSVRFTNGPGYKPKENVERYFEEAGDQKENLPPYYIALHGVFVNPAMAVPRAIRRELQTGRSVPIRQQLRSYKMFAQHFETYADWCDEARLYDTNVPVDIDRGELPPLVAAKTHGGQLELKDTHKYQQFLLQASLNVDAAEASQLFAV